MPSLNSLVLFSNSLSATQELVAREWAIGADKNAEFLILSLDWFGQMLTLI